MFDQESLEDSQPNDFYTYRARLVDVIDADTFDFEMNLGFNLRDTWRVRLETVDTHEIYGVEKNSEEYERGEEERIYAEYWFNQAHEKMEEPQWPLAVEANKRGKYGRVVGRVYRIGDGSNLGEDLIEEFDGIQYD